MRRFEKRKIVERARNLFCSKTQIPYGIRATYSLSKWILRRDKQLSWLFNVN